MSVVDHIIIAVEDLEKASARLCAHARARAELVRHAS